jgi:predicted GIY-YIG superfamily endonuclease
MEYLYVLKLEKEKWYIGRSANVERRYEQHLTGQGAKWTQLHKPLQIVLKRPLKDDEDEDNTTREFIKKYGENNVRGGSYCQVEPKRKYVAEIEWQNYSQIDEADSKRCYRCDRTSHFQADCYAKYDLEGDYIRD